MMKKITQRLLLLMLTVLSTNAFTQIANTTGLPGADLIYHEDGRYTTNAGYTISITGAATVATNGKKPADDALAGYVRPANNYPVTTAADYAATIKVNNSAGGNSASVMWYVINSVDLAGYDSGSKFFTIVTFSQYFEDGDTNIDNQNEFWYRNSATGDDPTTGASWTKIQANLINAHANGDLGADATWVATKVDLSSITCGDGFAIALKRTTTADGPNPNENSTAATGTNRNGSFFVSSHAITGSTTPLSVAENELDKAISIYPNPVKGILNISKIDANLSIKSTSLLDVTGRTVYNGTFTKSIDVSKFSKGLYILKIESQQGAISSKKVIIK